MVAAQQMPVRPNLDTAEDEVVVISSHTSDISSPTPNGPSTESRPTLL
ncbi:N-Acetylglucosaminyltransferase-IV (GnT-IV) conserved region family protein [Aspergillus niger]|uniref:N-Acetylglucosaminyltransferase-IV (GnT-IV) conserved region family protein n=1 Tax=Aspergillus niger TaxID=5061 RepID=A0A505IDI2_ASPNG|nr:N-Acetylglucosaminyltransferase-IV (GnT-IV) conserved region family protein [Aspergillus niger]